MLELVYEFLDDHSSEAKAEEYRLALSVIDSYKQNSTIYTDLISIVATDNYSSDDKLSYMDKCIHDEMNDVLKAHGIRLIEDARLDDKIEVLYSLFVIQHLDNYNQLGGLLESQQDDIELISEILSDYCMLGKTRLYEILDDVDDGFLDGLRKFVNDREQLLDDEKITRQYKEKLDIYKKYVVKDLVIPNSGVIAGASVKTYVNLFRELLEELSKENDKTMFVNEMFSIVLMSVESSVDPKMVFDKYVVEFVDDISELVKMNVMYHELLQKYLDAVSAKKMTEGLVQ